MHNSYDPFPVLRRLFKASFKSYKLLLVLLLFAAISSMPFLRKAAATGAISGVVYVDYNVNGVRDTTGVSPNLAVDKGLAGVTVTVYDAAGVARGSDTSAADGTYSISATGTGPYRVEFGTLAEYMPSSAGNDNGSSIQFVPDGNSTGIDFGVIRAKDYCQNDPVLVTTCFSGTVNGNSADPVLVSFPYSSGTTNTTDSTGVDAPGTHTLAVPQNVFGSVWGIAYHRSAQRVFASAFTKRHAGFRNANKGTADSDPTGEIFISNEDGTTAGLFINLNTLFGSNVMGNNPHDTTNYETDSTAFDAVGKTAVGDIDISDDDQTLYAVSLADRKIYGIPLGTGIPTAPTLSSQVTVYDLASIMDPGTGATGCPLDGTTPVGEMNLNLRPGGLKFKDDRLYVGLTCTAQSTGLTTDLRAFVYEMNPAGSGSAVQVANFALNYPRGCASDNGTLCADAEWQPWTNNVNDLLDFTPYSQKYLPQPWLLDIEFDQNDFMILGMSDRLGHQTGNANSGANTGTVEGVSAGETLRMYKNGATWTLENNASDNTNTTIGSGTGQGPGNGEFYYQEGYTIVGDTHSEISLGGLLNVPGFQDVVVSAFDPAPTGTLSGNPTYRAGGLIWLNNNTGARSRSYQLFGIDAVNTFGKASGIGDAEAMCDTAPIQVGNRIWNDADGDGIQDPGEAVFQNVVLQLWADTTGNGNVDTQVGSATTDLNGNYLFGGPGDTNLTGYSMVPSTLYEVRVLSSNFNSGQPLENYHPTTPDADVSANGDARDSDGVVFPGDVVTAQFTSGSGFGDNDHSFDFGFRPAAGGMPNHSIGNRVWYDTDNDGVIDPTEVGVPGVSVSLFLDAGGDGVPDTPGSPVGTVTTDANGYYRFDSLVANTYLVRINPGNFGAAALLEGYQNTTANNVADMDSYGAGVNAENGINPVAAVDVITSGVLSNPITVSASTEPLTEADVPSAGLFSGQGSLDGFADMTVDFGFYCLSLSGTVWHDAGAGPDSDDGELDTGETLLVNYQVRLYDPVGNEIPVGADGILGTADDGPGGMLTITGGNYAFSCLPESDYRVVLQANGASSSGPTESDPDSNGDDNDNGYPDDTGFHTAQLISGVVTLAPGSTGAMGNNAVNNGLGSTSDPTVDFGIFLSPTHIKLDRFEAFYKGQSVVLEWNTGDETENLGFNIYRSTKGGTQMLNSSLIAGTALRSGVNLNVSAGDYSWVDGSPEPDTFYFLEDIDLNGNKTMHGPVSPKLRFGFEGLHSNSALVSDLRYSPTKETETVIEKKDGVWTEEDTERSARQRKISAKKGVKILVSTDDLYTVSFEQLAAEGFDINSDPSHWQMFADGEEVPILISDGGAVRWFGRAIDTQFTGTRTYYLVEGDSRGLRIQDEEYRKTKLDNKAHSFRITVARKHRDVYVSSILNGERENWFGPLVSWNGDTEVELSAASPDPGDPRDAILKVSLQGLSAGEHLVGLEFNGVQIGTVEFENRENREFEFNIPMSEIRVGTNTVTLRSVGASGDLSLIDTTSLQYSKKYRSDSNKLRFSVPAGRSAYVDGFGESEIEIFEIDGSGKAFKRAGISAQKDQGSFGFSIGLAQIEREFIAIGAGYTPNEAEISENFPSHLRSEKNGTDVLIIAPRSFGKAAVKLANQKRSRGLRATFVAVEDIYDEFGFGRKSDQAIRDFIELALRDWRVPPGYLILFGDSSFDMRQYSGMPDRDLVPTHLIDTATMETSSDAWFADFDDDGVEDIPIGRLPAGNLDEAFQIVNKIARYEADRPHRQTKSLLVADTTFESYSDSLANDLPEYVSAVKLNRIQMPDSVLRQRILVEIETGPMVVTYTGHGSTGLWASRDVFGLTDAGSLTNERLSFFMLMTCLNGFTHNVTGDSLSERLLFSANGAISVWASSGATHANEQFMMSRAVTGPLFERTKRIGDLTRAAKLAASDTDVRRTWHLFGDPTLTIR